MPRKTKKRLKAKETNDKLKLRLVQLRRWKKAKTDKVRIILIVTFSSKTYLSTPISQTRAVLIMHSNYGNHYYHQ